MATFKRALCQVISFGLLLTCTLSSSRSVKASSGTFVYFGTSNYEGKIRRAASDGSNQVDILSCVPRDLEISVSTQQIFFTESDGFIYRCNLDGTGKVRVSDQTSMAHISIDDLSHKVYATQGEQRTVCYNYDGSGFQVLFDLAGLRSLSVDPVSKAIYATVVGAPNDRIVKWTPGGLITTLVDFGVRPGSWNDVLGDIQLDQQSGKLYWTDAYTNRIERSNSDGTSIEPLVQDSGRYILVREGRLYWSAPYSPYGHGVLRANADGTNIQLAIASEFDVQGFDLYDLVDSTSPTCVLGSVVTENATRVYVPITLMDGGCGVAQVKLTSHSTNCQLEWTGPGGVVTAPINTLITINPPTLNTQVRVVKLNTSQRSRVELQAWDAAGNTRVVNPVIANLVIKQRQVERTFNGIPQAERYVTLQNGTPGLTRATLWVNGRVVSRGSLTDGQVVSLDVIQWLRPGKRNVVRIAASGPKGATAVFTIGDVAPNAGAVLSATGAAGVNWEFAP